MLAVGAWKDAFLAVGLSVYVKSFWQLLLHTLSSWTVLTVTAAYNPILNRSDSYCCIQSHLEPFWQLLLHTTLILNHSDSYCCIQLSPWTVLTVTVAYNSHPEPFWQLLLHALSSWTVLRVSAVHALILNRLDSYCRTLSSWTVLTVTAVHALILNRFDSYCCIHSYLEPFW